MSDFFHVPSWPGRPYQGNQYLTSRHTDTGDGKVRSPSGYKSKVRVSDRYKVVGFISSGTYGRVYKAIGVNGQTGDFAIKK